MSISVCGGFVAILAHGCFFMQFHLIHAPADRYVNEAQPRAMMTALQGWGISSCTLEGGPGEHFDGVRGALVPWLAGVLIPLLRASLDTLDGADERRRMEAAGFREGLEGEGGCGVGFFFAKSQYVC